MAAADETREGIALSNLDTALFPGSDATKRDLVDHLDAVGDRLVAALTGRALSVVRVLRGQDPFMQKNTPRYAPDWLPTLPAWAASSGRSVRYPVVDDRRSLLWFGNQRAVEYHPQLFTGTEWHRQTHLVLDLDPPAAEADGDAEEGFRAAARAAVLVREVLTSSGMAAAVKTSGSKGVHVVVPLAVPPDGAAALPAADGSGSWTEDVMAATRAVAARAERLDPALATTAYIKADRGGKVFLDATRSGGATVVAVYSPRVRPGTPVSWPVAWSDLDRVLPRDATVRTVRTLLPPDGDPWLDLLPAPQALDPALVEEGRTIPVARVAAMHEGKRRAKARREAADAGAGGAMSPPAGDGPTT